MPDKKAFANMGKLETYFTYMVQEMDRESITEGVDFFFIREFMM